MLALAAGAATAKDLKITPTPAEGQSLTYVKGYPALISQQPRGIVVLILNSNRIPSKDKVPLVVGIENKSDAAINFSTTNITTTTDAGATRVLEVADLQAEARASVRRQVFWAGVGAAGAAMSAASATDQPGTFNSTTSFSGPFAHTSGTYTAPESGEDERARADRNAAMFAARAQAARESQGGLEAKAEQQGFQPATLSAGAHVLTPMPLSQLPAKATKLSVTVQLNGETHAFNFAIAPAS